jgi:hypothetical protein
MGKGHRTDYLITMYWILFSFLANLSGFQIPVLITVRLLDWWRRNCFYGLLDFAGFKADLWWSFDEIRVKKLSILSQFIVFSSVQWSKFATEFSKLAYWVQAHSKSSIITADNLFTFYCSDKSTSKNWSHNS